MAQEVRVDVTSSCSLILRAREGDEAARNELCARYLPGFASGPTQTVSGMR